MAEVPLLLACKYRRHKNDYNNKVKFFNLFYFIFDRLYVYLAKNGRSDRDNPSGNVFLPKFNGNFLNIIFL